MASQILTLVQESKEEEKPGGVQNNTKAKQSNSKMNPE